MTVVTGLIDAFSYLCLGQILVANMTGNIVFAGFAVGSAPGFNAWALLLAVAAFFAGAWSGGHFITRLGSHRGRLLCAAATVESMLFGAAWMASLSGPSPYTGGNLALLITLLGLAMGLQNAAARSLQIPDLTTSVLTLTITGIAADATSHTGNRWGRRTVPILTMFLGGAAGAVLVVHDLAPWNLGLAAFLTATVAAVSVRTLRSSESWTRGAAVPAQQQPEKRRGRRAR